MMKPKKLTPSQLVHPKAPEKSKFNGDLLRKEGSFNDRVTLVTHNEVAAPKPGQRKLPPVARKIEPYPEDHVFCRHRRMAVPEPKSLTDRQKRQVRGL